MGLMARIPSPGAGGAQCSITGTGLPLSARMATGPYRNEAAVVQLQADWEH